MAFAGSRLNRLDVSELEHYIASVRSDAAEADRAPAVVGRWIGGTRAEVSSAGGGAAVYMGGPEDASAMGMLLRSLAACEIEVVVTRATLLGIEIEDLSVEARAHFNVARYLGVDAAEGSGFQRVSYVVHLRTRNPLAPDQLADLRAGLAASPVGDTFARRVPVEFDIVLD